MAGFESSTQFKSQQPPINSSRGQQSNWPIQDSWAIYSLPLLVTVQSQTRTILGLKSAVGTVSLHTLLWQTFVKWSKWLVCYQCQFKFYLGLGWWESQPTESGKNKCLHHKVDSNGEPWMVHHKFEFADKQLKMHERIGWSDQSPEIRSGRRRLRWRQGLVLTMGWKYP